MRSRSRNLPGPGNDWVLPDPDRTVSKTHCVSSIEHGQTVLTDLSTNGVHINGARQATARDSRTELVDDDDFRLGDYTISVAVVEAAERGRAAAALDDPFDGPAGPAEGGSPLGFDPLDDPLGQPPSPGFAHPVMHRASGPKREDPFDVAQERAQRPADPDDDPFRGARPTQEWQGPAQPDHADAPRHAFAAPVVLPGGMRDPFAELDGLLADDPAPARTLRRSPLLPLLLPPAPCPLLPRPAAMRCCVLFSRARAWRRRCRPRPIRRARCARSARFSAP